MDIFSPVALGALSLSNRIVMAPMTRDRAGSQDEPTPLMVEYYRQRASAGLIVTEGVQPSAEGKGYWRTPGLHSDEQIKGWRQVATAVHARGGQIVAQLMHVGRAAAAANKDPGIETIAPSAIASRDPIAGPDGTLVPPVMPRALETSEIPQVVEQFAQAARNARAAGLDGVELHCTSGYLPMQFLSTGSNQRNDRYGGNTANRIRFVVETMEAMGDAIGADRVGFRIFPGNRYNDMSDEDPAETYGALVDALAPGGFAYMHLIHYATPQLDALALLRPRWRGAIIANNALKLESAQALLATGQVDAVSFGKPYISNPDLVERFRAGAPLAPQSRNFLYTGEERGYTDYPRWSEATTQVTPHEEPAAS
jgi:N-ethylmaleimide reductase